MGQENNPHHNQHQYYLQQDNPQMPHLCFHLLEINLAKGDKQNHKHE